MLNRSMHVAAGLALLLAVACRGGGDGSGGDGGSGGSGGSGQGGLSNATELQCPYPGQLLDRCCHHSSPCPCPIPRLPQGRSM